MSILNYNIKLLLERKQNKSNFDPTLLPDVFQPPNEALEIRCTLLSGACYEIMFLGYFSIVVGNDDWFSKDEKHLDKESLDDPPFLQLGEFI